MALLEGCTPPPEEVADTGLTVDPPSSTSESSTANPPGPTTEGSATVASADGTGTSGTSDEGPATTMPVDGTGTTTSEPATTSGASEGTGSSSGMGMESSGTTTGGTDSCHPLLAEVLYDPNGGNGGNQWIRLYNPCPGDIDLTGYSLGWGGNDYAAQGGDLSGTIPAGECFLLGGPTSNPNSYQPVFDLVLDFSADLQIGGAAADGIALFADVESNIAADTIPLDAVIYGDANSNALLDAEGNTPDPHVGSAPETESIRRTALTPTWVIEPAPTPNECPAL